MFEQFKKKFLYVYKALLLPEEEDGVMLFKTY